MRIYKKIKKISESYNKPKTYSKGAVLQPGDSFGVGSARFT